MKKKLFSLALLAGSLSYAQSWNLTGNASTNETSNFLGTTDSRSLIIKTNNTEKLRILADGTFKFQGLLTQGLVYDKNLYFGGGNMTSSTSNVNNTVFGLGALTLNQTGGGNTAIGANAIGSMQASNNNVAIGLNALANANSGALNVSIGTNSMTYYGIYNENVAIGFASLERSSSSSADIVSYNTSLGSRSLAYLKNGEKNIAIGYNSIKMLTSGTSNIAIGASSGLSLTSGNGNILIGDSTNPTTPTSSNQLNIGNWIVGNNGVIGIGTFSTTLPSNGVAQDGEKYKLFVKDGIKTEKVKVDVPSSNGWADYVFKKDYQLRSLEEVEKHIAEKGHLPNIPSAEEVNREGINLGEMNVKLLEKIEELTLYSIEQNKQIKSQTEQLNQQSAELQMLKQQVQLFLSTQK